MNLNVMNLNHFLKKPWIKLNENYNVKFDYDLWSYFGKYYFKANRKKLINDSILNEYVFGSNNACESLNNLINNFIQIDSKVGLDKFETIIKTLIIRLE